MDDDPSYDIRVAVVDHAAAPIDAAPVRQAVEQTLQRHSCPSARISVAVVGDARIAELNQQFLSHEGPTDVLTFNLTEAANGLDAEIIISAETAHRQAQQRGHQMMDELLLYAVHGTLHLLGMDDHSEDDAERMHRLENEILSDLGRGPVYGGDNP
ncbi:MAG: rRNA maturation RNase YbeY [Planctomycetes bacterium]|nr:rRNA maturation RNase YbeY [Planctomycetota bacterium]